MINAKELKEFLGKLDAMCDCYNGCEGCPLDAHCCVIAKATLNELEFIFSAVEAWHKAHSGKPCPEIIDKAVDIYTLEVEVERGRLRTAYWTVKEGADNIAQLIENDYGRNCTTARVISAKRYVRESHREDAE